MPKFAANLSLMFNELGFLERFAAARAAGFDAVEFLFPYVFEPEQIVGRLQRYGLQLVLHNFPPGDWGAGGPRGPLGRPVLRRAVLWLPWAAVGLLLAARPLLVGRLSLVRPPLVSYTSLPHPLQSRQTAEPACAAGAAKAGCPPLLLLLLLLLPCCQDQGAQMWGQPRLPHPPLRPLTQPSAV